MDPTNPHQENAKQVLIKELEAIEPVLIKLLSYNIVNLKNVRGKILYEQACDQIKKVKIQTETMLTLALGEELKYNEAEEEYLNSHTKLRLEDNNQINSINSMIYLNLLKDQLKPLGEALDQLIVYQNYDDFIMERIFIYKKRIYLLIHYARGMINMPYNDILFISKDHPRRQEVSKRVEIVNFGSEEEVTRSRDKLLRMIHTWFATLQSTYQEQDSAFKWVKQLSSFPIKLLRRDNSHHKAMLFHSEHHWDLMKVLDRVESGPMWVGMSLMFPSISFSQHFYIHRNYPILTIQHLNEKADKGAWLNENENIFEENDYQKMKDSSENSSNISFEKLLNRKKSKNEDLVDILLMCPKGFNKSDISNNNKYEQIIIQIHGGGWVAASADGHQVYTRRWATQLDTPVFAINYRKAPEYEYPGGLDDCWQAYNWIVDNVQRVLGFKPKKIVLAGDSAGGNLAAALTTLLIKENRRIPDGLLLVYPCLNIEPGLGTPSFVSAINSEFLSLTLLSCNWRAYIKGLDYKGGHPTASPLIAEPYIIKKYPKIRIMQGSHDPLIDECWRFMEILLNQKVDAKLYIYEGIIHAILNFDLLVGPPEAKKFVKESIRIFKEELFQ